MNVSPNAHKHAPKPPEIYPRPEIIELFTEVGNRKVIERTNPQWKVGANITFAGGPEYAVVKAAEVGANSFSFFLKSKPVVAPYTPESIEVFKQAMKEFKYSSSDVLPHGYNQINLGSPYHSQREQAYGVFLDDLRRCEQLELSLYNFHPGSVVEDTPREKAIENIAAYINRAHRETEGITLVLENAVVGKPDIGGTFDELQAIIEQVDDKSRIGVCLDTRHLFTSGYDIRRKPTYMEMMQEFDSKIGLSYLRAMHLNDSKTDLGTKMDVDIKFGTGYIQMVGFHALLNDPRTQKIPLIIESVSFEVTKQELASEISNVAALSGMHLSPAELKVKEPRLRKVVGRARKHQRVIDERKKNLMIDREHSERTFGSQKRYQERGPTSGNGRSDSQDRRPPDSQERRFNSDDRRSDSQDRRPPAYQERRFDSDDRRSDLQDRRPQAYGERRFDSEHRRSDSEDRRPPAHQERRFNSDDRRSDFQDRQPPAYRERRFDSEDRRSDSKDRRPPAYQERRFNSDDRRSNLQDHRPRRFAERQFESDVNKGRMEGYRPRSSRELPEND